MVKFNEIFLATEPTRIRLREALAIVAEKTELLNTKKAALKIITDKVDILEK